MSRTQWLGIGFLLSAFAVAPALAVCIQDGTGHPSASVIFGQDTDPGTCNEQIISACEAVLVSPTVAITTGDCTETWINPDPFTITATWLSNNPLDNVDCGTADRIASFVTHPSFDPAHPDSPFNIGVIQLAAPSTHPYASLPAAGAIDLLSRNEPLDAVAYTRDELFVTTRKVGSAVLARTTEDLFKIRKADNDSCTFDVPGSGVFLPGGQSVVGINLAVRGWNLRLDIPEVRDFLDDYVTLP